MNLQKALEYPLEIDFILRKRKSIKRDLLRKNHFYSKKIAILGGSTTSEIKHILEIFLLKNGIKPIFYESNYNLYYEDATFGNVQLEEFKPDFVYIHTTHHNIKKYPLISDSEIEVHKLIENEIVKLRGM